MTMLVPDWPGLPPNVKALCTTRAGGFSQAPYDDGMGGGGLNLGSHVGDTPAEVMRNRALLRARLPDEPVWLSQVHGNRVVNASCPDGDVPQADASVTADSGVVCAVMTADCLPVLLSDADGRVVGAAHAGWRGLAGGVLESAVAAMREAGAEEIIAWLGPAIGPAEFEVGSDVLEAFTAFDAAAAEAFVPRAGQEGKFHADIYRLARQRLAKLGVSKVAGGEWCTVRDRRFYSFRRDRITGRMASVIWKD